jgi:phenylpropionate dioxygenase-like ring-hydroxylating dioxygenase large terminal subunit
MKKEEQIKQLKLLMQRLDDGTTVDAGVILKNPASAYTCAELAGREWETFFRGHPQLLGLSGDLPEPGSFLTTSDFGIPILATRGRD